MGKFVKNPLGPGLAPTAETLAKVHANPKAYPDALKDFASMGGLSKAEAMSRYNLHDDSDLGQTLRTVDSIEKGFVKGTAKAIENVIDSGMAASEMVQNVFRGDDEEQVQYERTKGAVSDSLQGPEGTATHIATVGAQIIPGILAGGGVAKALKDAPKALKWLSVLATDSAVDAITFDVDDKNIVEVAHELGIDKSILSGLVKNPEDPELLNRLKNGFTNGSFGTAAAAVIGVLGKLVFRRGTGKVIDEVADEALPALAKSETKVVSDITSNVVPSIPRVTEELTSQQALVIRETSSQLKVTDDVIAAQTGKQSGAPQPDEAFRPFIEKMLAPLRRFVSQGVKDSSERLRLQKILDVDGPAYAKHANRLLRKLSEGDLAGAVNLARVGLKTGSKELDALYRQSSIKGLLDAAQDNFSRVIKVIRQSPKLATDDAYKKVYSDYFDQVINLHMLYRTLGTQSSYEQLIRKGVLTGDAGNALIREMDDAITDFELKLKVGDSFEKFKLIRTKEVFDLTNGAEDMMKLDEILEREFLDFKNLPVYKALKMEVKTGVMASAIRFLKELQSYMLLSQLSTVSLNAISTGLHAVALPMYRAIGAGDVKGTYREFVGYTYAMRESLEAAGKAMKMKEGVLDKYDLTELRHSSAFKPGDGASLIHRMMARAITFLVDLQLGADEFFKQLRYRGVRYARGVEIAESLGKTGVKAKKFAKAYIIKGIDHQTGKGLDVQDLNEASKVAFQQRFDDRYLGGRFLQAFDNIRRREDLVGLLTHIVVPFFRTPINIFNIAMQTIPASQIVVGIPMKGLEMISRKMGVEARFAPKFVDDFIGKNGPRQAAEARAQAAIGWSIFGGVMAMQQAGMISLTGPTRLKDWKGQKRQRELLPPNSIIIDGKPYDLTRFLPFTAPLIMAGALSDTLRNLEDESLGISIHSQDAANEYLEISNAYTIGVASMLKDSASLQGVSGFLKALSDGVLAGDGERFGRWASRIPAQFIPGHIKMVSKWENEEAREGYDFLTRIQVQMWGSNGYQKRDVLGDAVIYDKSRGFVPGLSLKDLSHLTPLKQEIYELMQKTGMHLTLPMPHELFRSDFTQAGYKKGDYPSMTELSATWKGKKVSAWDFYRNAVYDVPLKGSKAVTVSGTSEGRKSTRKKSNPDHFTVNVIKGENLKASLTRLKDDPKYTKASWETRRDIMDSVFNHYKKIAKSVTAQIVQFEHAEGKTMPLKDLKVMRRLNKRLNRIHNTGNNSFGDLFQTMPNARPPELLSSR
ncbi:MAG: hypothetical protein JKY49_00455 [Cohaesibacteraceae bacterium]|nr:hypothetical protein [Cohaesibacteraceae bacterium]MBL4875770.1 hypothetical protein [Cohaesibacteraceae bacterium]